MAFDDFKVANYPQALVSPELYGRHLSRLLTGDVIDGLTVVPGTGLQVVLQPGNALVRYGSAAVASARHVSLVATYNLAIATPDASNPRNDLVVLFVNNSVNLPSGTPTSANLDGPTVAQVVVVAGTPNATPTDPSASAIQAAIGSSSYPYTILQRVRVDNGVSVIASNKITDIRSIVRVRRTDTGLGGAPAQITANFSNATATVTAVTGLSRTVTVPSDTTTLKISVFAQSAYNATANTSAVVSIWDGPVGSGTKLSQGVITSSQANAQNIVNVFAYPPVTPGAAKTYNVGLVRAGGTTATLSAATDAPATLAVDPY